ANSISFPLTRSTLVDIAAAHSMLRRWRSRVMVRSLRRAAIVVSMLLAIASCAGASAGPAPQAPVAPRPPGPPTAILPAAAVVTPEYVEPLACREACAIGPVHGWNPIEAPPLGGPWSLPGMLRPAIRVPNDPKEAPDSTEIERAGIDVAAKYLGLTRDGK